MTACFQCEWEYQIKSLIEKVNDLDKGLEYEHQNTNGSASEQWISELNKRKAWCQTEIQKINNESVSFGHQNIVKINHITCHIGSKITRLIFSQITVCFAQKDQRSNKFQMNDSNYCMMNDSNCCMMNDSNCCMMNDSNYCMTTRIIPLFFLHCSATIHYHPLYHVSLSLLVPCFAIAPCTMFRYRSLYHVSLSLLDHCSAIAP
jgi:hypothetical protein